LERWAAELGWRWNDAADIADLTRHSMTPARIPLTVAPQVHSVELGPPVTLLVRMLPGQIVDDFETRAERIAAAMDIPAVHIESYEPGWVKVILLDDEPVE
jgi:S-DNA-T family DNA segregation ATPase FtsK/SpoIIIE